MLREVQKPATYVLVKALAKGLPFGPPASELGDELFVAQRRHGHRPNPSLQTLKLYPFWELAYCSWGHVSSSHI